MFPNSHSSHPPYSLPIARKFRNHHVHVSSMLTYPSRLHNRHAYALAFFQSRQSFWRLGGLAVGGQGRMGGPLVRPPPTACVRRRRFLSNTKETFLPLTDSSITPVLVPDRPIHTRPPNERPVELPGADTAICPMCLQNSPQGQTKQLPRRK